MSKLAYGSFAFEAPYDHYNYFQSIARGNFPEIVTVDTCVNVASDDLTLARLAVRR